LGSVVNESFLQESIETTQIEIISTAVGFIVMYMQMLQCSDAVLQFLKVRYRRLQV